jgi:membrane-associated phospholipid phosphatase
MRQALSFLLLMLPLLVLCQRRSSPHVLKADREFTLVGAGLILGGSALYLKSQNEPISSAPTLNVYDVPRVERFATRRWSPIDGNISDGLLVGSCVAASGIFADRNARKDWLVIGVMGLETALLTTSLTYDAKWGADRYRPYVYNADAPLSERMAPDIRESFFSGHTSFCAAATFFSARVWCDYHPHAKANAAIWAAAAVLPALTGIERVRAGKHFPTDVVAGYAAGAAIGYLVPVVHRRGNGKSAYSVSASPSMNGVHLMVQF